MVNAMLKIGFEVQGKAREILNEKVYNTGIESPSYVRTGHLRASVLFDGKIVKKKDLLKATVGVDTTKASEAKIKGLVHYAAYVEFGTSKMKARAFLLPAVQMSNDEIMEILNEAIMDYLNKEGGN